jgi:hypothetical protein
LENGDVVTASPKGVNGRRTSASVEGKFTQADKVKHIRVIGREEWTNAEEARYRFLKSFLNNTRNIPSFVKIIWFPTNKRRAQSRYDGRAGSSLCNASHLLMQLNNSQQEVATAMLSVSPRDSLVIAHGIPYCHCNWFPPADGIPTAQGLREQERRLQLPLPRQHGYIVNFLGG